MDATPYSRNDSTRVVTSEINIYLRSGWVVRRDSRQTVQVVGDAVRDVEDTRAQFMT